MATEYINVEPDWVRMFDYCIHQARCNKDETTVQMLEYGKRLHLADVERLAETPETPALDPSC